MATKIEILSRISHLKGIRDESFQTALHNAVMGEDWEYAEELLATSQGEPGSGNFSVTIDQLIALLPQRRRSSETTIPFK